ncbi:MAG: zinc finger protein [Oscillospiraceae bacterium]
MFTKIGNVVLWIGVIVGFIASIILGVVLGKEHGGIGFLVVVLGWVVTLIGNMAFGIIIEVSNNVQRTADNSDRSRELLEKMVRGYRENTEDTSAKSSGNNKSYDLLAMVERNTWTCPNCGNKNDEGSTACTRCKTQKSASENNDWFCSKCGEKNGSAYPYCTICGQPRLNKIQLTPSQQRKPEIKRDYWTCKVCGETNDEFSYTCSKCGSSKY